MFELKPLSREAIPRSLEKAMRYRLLNEPLEAESICRDVLELDPDNQEALVALVLALTDQLGSTRRSTFNEARVFIAQLDGEYDRHYYNGLLFERWAKACYKRGAPGSGPQCYDDLRRAMDHFEQAADLAPPDNEDAILRWNTCVRFIATHDDVVAPVVETFRPMLE